MARFIGDGGSVKDLLSNTAGRFADAIDRLDQFSMYLAAAGLTAMSAIVFSEVVLRSLFTRSLLIADEIAAYMLAMVSFFAFANTLRKEGHIRVTLLFHRMPAGVRKGLEIVFILVAIVSLYFWTKWLLLLVIDSYVGKIDSQSQIETPLWIPQATLVYGAFVLGLALVARLVRVLKDEIEP